MRFRYTFQKIVDLKNNEKTQQEWMLSSAVGKLKEEESTLSELERQKLELQREIQSTSADRTKVSDLMVYQSYMSHIDTQIVKKNGDVRNAQSRVVKQQEALSAKMVEEKIWSNAREKAKQVYLTGALKKEQESLDEIATNRHKKLS
jgi:flagellar protein FliJ